MSGDIGEETTNITGTRHTLPFLKNLFTYFQATFLSACTTYKVTL